MPGVQDRAQSSSLRGLALFGTQAIPSKYSQKVHKLRILFQYSTNNIILIFTLAIFVFFYETTFTEIVED